MLWDALGFLKIDGDALGCFGMLWDALGFLKIDGDALGCFGMLWDALGFLNSWRFFKINGDAVRWLWRLQDAWDSWRSIEMLWDALRRLGDAMGCYGMLWKWFEVAFMKATNLKASETRHRMELICKWEAFKVKSHGQVQRRQRRWELHPSPRPQCYLKKVDGLSSSGRSGSRWGGVRMIRGASQR